MLWDELTQDDKDTITKAENLEDMMLNSGGWKIVQEWLNNKKNKAAKVESIDTKKTAEEIKIDIIVAQETRKIYDDLEKYVINQINKGKNLIMQLNLERPLQ